MRRSDHPSRPSAMTCCLFSSLKTLLTLTEVILASGSMSCSALLLAGFQLIIIGRFWVIPEVMALFLALTLFQHLINGFHNRDLRRLVVDLLGVTAAEYTASQMTYDLRRLRLKGLIYRPPKTHHYFLTPYGWKIARLFTRLEARVFRPAVAMFTGNDAVLPFPLRASLDRIDVHLDELIYEAFPHAKAS
jgi:hypothetical protein